MLAVSCGSIAFPHVDDPGFGLFEEHFALSAVRAVKVRTTYTTPPAPGLGGVLAAEGTLDVLGPRPPAPIPLRTRSPKTA